MEIEISKVEKLLETEVECTTLVARPKALTSQLQYTQKLRAQLWRLKSRFKTLRENDANRKYFHTLATLRSKRNQIIELQIGDTLIKDHVALKDKIMGYFQYFYNQRSVPDIDLLDNAVWMMQPLKSFLLMGR